MNMLLIAFGAVWILILGTVIWYIGWGSKKDIDIKKVMLVLGIAAAVAVTAMIILSGLS